MKKKLDDLGVSAFCESMAMMVQSGIQMDEAVILLMQGHGQGGLLEQGLAVMKEETEQGRSLSNAMKAADIFPQYAIQMISAGETTGRLEDVLFRLSRYYADQSTMAGKLKNAVTYPAVMMVMIIAVLAVMLTMVLPSFTDVYNRLTGSLAASSYSYIRWAYGFCWAALAVMAVLAVLLTGGYLLWGGRRRNVVEGALRKVPICASILEEMGMFRFTAALSTYLASGEMQDTAVIESMGMVDYKPVEDKLRRCVTHMEEGHSIAQAAYEEHLFEPVYGRMLLAGERSGGLEQVLQRLNGLLEEHCTELVDRLVGIVDPLLSGVLMLTVGVSLLSVMLPLIGMMNSIG